ncbi:hypothetical protein SAMN05216604_103301 [Pseudomonas agarici]|nr:hypothetical protein SAMN05216604_103301 [Pseudomonas agarici]
MPKCPVIIFICKTNRTFLQIKALTALALFVVSGP